MADKLTTYSDIMAELQSLANPANVEGMSRFGIRPKTTGFGISVVDVRAIASAERIQQQDSKAARWIAADALRELVSDKTQQRLKK